MCCHLNRFAPLGRCISSVISTPEVTKSWRGKFLSAGGYAVVPSLCHPQMKQGSRAPCLEERTYAQELLKEPVGVEAVGLTQSQQTCPPPPSPLNPIPRNRLEKKSICPKPRAQRETLESSNTFWSGIRIWSSQRIPSASLHNEYHLTHMTETIQTGIHRGAAHLCESYLIIRPQKRSYPL